MDINVAKKWICAAGLMLVSSVLSGNAMASATDEYDGIEITVSINEASEEELDKLLIGIGREKAKAIIQYRTKNGPFETIEDIVLVKGVGSSILEKNRHRLLL